MDWKNKPNQIFNKVKNQMYSKGVQSFYYVDQFICQFDPDFTGVLNPHFFNLFLNKVGVFLSTQQIRNIKDIYSRQNKQQIHYREFLEDVKYSISQNIANLLNQAFQKIVQKQGDRHVSLERLQKYYLAQKHPKSLTRVRAPQEIRQIFLTGIKRKSKEGWVSKEAFIDYYAQLNFCIPQQRQSYFQQILIGTWNLVNPAQYVSPKRLRQIQQILFQKIRQKNDGKTNQWKTGKKAMSYFDLNDNGKCQFNQFVKGMDKFGCNFKQWELRALFDKYDADHSGFLNYQEFAKMIMQIDLSGLATKPNLFTQTMGKNHFTITK